MSRVVIDVAGTGAATASVSWAAPTLVGAAASSTVRYAVKGDGSGSVVVTVRGLDASGATVARATDVLFVRDSFGTLIACDQGALDLKLTHLQRAYDRGVLDAAGLAASQDRVRGGGATQQSAIGSAGPSTGFGPGQVTATGTILWTDSAGATHPTSPTDRSSRST